MKTVTYCTLCLHHFALYMYIYYIPPSLDNGLEKTEVQREAAQAHVDEVILDVYFRHLYIVSSFSAFSLLSNACSLLPFRCFLCSLRAISYSLDPPPCFLNALLKLALFPFPIKNFTYQS